MKKEVIVVPQDKCPLDILAEMGERTKNALILLHHNVIRKLKSTADSYESCPYKCIQFHWDSTDEFPETTVLVRYHDDRRYGWDKILYIKADDIAFSSTVKNPVEIIFLQMEK